MAQSLSINNATRQIAREDILNYQYYSWGFHSWCHYYIVQLPGEKAMIMKLKILHLTFNPYSAKGLGDRL